MYLTKKKSVMYLLNFKFYLMILTEGMFGLSYVEFMNIAYD